VQNNQILGLQNRIVGLEGQVEDLQAVIVEGVRVAGAMLHARDNQIIDLQNQAALQALPQLAVGAAAKIGVLPLIGITIGVIATPFMFRHLCQQGWITSEDWCGAMNRTAEMFVAAAPFALATAAIAIPFGAAGGLGAGVGGGLLGFSGALGYTVHQQMTEKEQQQFNQNLKTALLEASELAPAIPRTLKRVMQAGELALLFTIGATALAYTPVFSASKNFLTRSRRTPLKKKNASTQKRKLR
jgi:hypothetical protein